MWHEGRDVDEVTWFDFLLEFHVVAPAHFAVAGYDVDDGFDFAVVVYAAGGVGGDDGYAAPDAL